MKFRSLKKNEKKIFFFQNCSRAVKEAGERVKSSKAEFCRERGGREFKAEFCRESGGSEFNSSSSHGNVLA